MMEFVLSRVTVSICGLMLLAAVIVPVMGIYESKTERMESDVSDNIAKVIDSFYYSEMNEFTVAMSDILPSSSSYLEFDGHIITLTTERGEYRSGTNATVISDGSPFIYGDILRLSKKDGGVVAEKLA